MDRVLDAAEVQKLLAQPQQKPRSKKEPDTADRSVRGWFKLEHHFSEEYQCECPNHDETPRIENGPPIPDGAKISRKRAVAVVDEVPICRFCYIEKRDLIAS